MIKQRELEAFDAFMRLGNMKGAGELLGLSQPAISRLLVTFEAQIGFALFVRKRNRLTPTPEALQYHQTVQRTLAALRDAEEEAVAIANKKTGHLVIAAQPVFCDTFLLDAVAIFREKHPGVSVKLVDVGLEEMTRMLAERTCDMALGITLDAEAFGATATTLARCEACCILPIDHPLNETDVLPLPRLRQETFIDLSLGSPLRTRVDFLMQTIDVKREIAAEMRNLRGVVKLVEMGMGLAIVDPVACRLLDPDKAVTRPLLPSISWEIAQFVPRDRQISAVGQAFLEVIRTEIDLLKEQKLVV
ncbi:LysR family transcriptional regulator [Thalassobius sp. Cn5-15]|uniref:LysR family transcriptional regulator n=1 Tax=Thalassobius sp. Cn5-15 TaxID=2917763 RepID=UPI001EF335D3|nr:LysR substrate-binding domain-containing protein [Thalassobius sp. Cn5-15]MCG7494381.1 LysR substrate-binding domain-containing protein [Thalassobius sp. Cn5-15]